VHKKPCVYLNYRNYIIKLYRENPNAYLSATECRKKVPGDVCSVIRLHAFLEHWGLINFNVDTMLKPPKLHLGGSGTISDQLIDVVAKGYLNADDANKIAAKANSKHWQENSLNHETVYLIAAKKINAISKCKSPLCNFCGNACGFSWYQKKSHDFMQDPDD